MMSAKARKAISLAQKERWAKFRANGGSAPRKTSAHKPRKASDREILSAMETLSRLFAR